MRRAIGLLCGVAMLLTCCTGRSGPVAPATAATRGGVGAATAAACPEVERVPEGALARLGSRAFRMTGQPRGLAYDPTGKVLYGSSNVALSRARAFDAGTGAPVVPFGGRFAPFDTPSLSRDGARAACLPEHYTINDNVAVYETATGRKLLATGVPTYAQVGPFALSPDGKLLAIATYSDGFRGLRPYSHDILLYDVDGPAEGRPVVLRGIRQHVTSLVFSPDGGYLAAACGDGIRLYRTGSAELLKTFPPVGNSLSFAHDSRYLAAGNYRTVVWDTTTFAEAAADLPLAGPIAFSPSGHVLAGPRRPAALTGPYDTVVLYDLDSKETQSLKVSHTDAIRSLAFSPDGRRLATAGDDSQLHQYDLTTYREMSVPDGHWSGVLAVAWSADGRRIASGDDKGLVYVWDAETGAAIQHLQPVPNVRVWSVSFSGDDRILAVAPAGSWMNAPADTTFLFDTSTWQIWARVAHSAVEYGQSKLSHDGRFVVRSNYGELDIFAVDPDQAKPVRHVACGGFYPSAKGDVLGCLEGDRLVVSDFATGKVLHKSDALNALDKPNIRPPLAISPDGRVQVTSTYCLAVSGYNPKTNPPQVFPPLVDTYAHHELLAVALSPDVTRLAAILNNGEVRLYDVATGERLAIYRADAQARAVAFSPDSRRLVTGHDDASVLLWPATPGKR